MDTLGAAIQAVSFHIDRKALKSNLGPVNNLFRWHELGSTILFSELFSAASHAVRFDCMYALWVSLACRGLFVCEGDLSDLFWQIVHAEDLLYEEAVRVFKPPTSVSKQAIGSNTHAPTL